MPETLLEINFEADAKESLKGVINQDRQEILKQHAEKMTREMVNLCDYDGKIRVTEMMYLAATLVLNIIVNTEKRSSPNQFTGAMNMFYHMILAAFETAGIKVVAAPD